jgi:hypothetical protein
VIGDGRVQPHLREAVSALSFAVPHRDGEPPLCSASKVLLPKEEETRKRCQIKPPLRSVYDPEAEVHFINMAALKRTHKPDQIGLSDLLVEKTANDAQQLDWAVGLGHVIITPGSPCLLLVALNGEGTDRKDRDCFATGQCLDLPRGMRLLI